MDTTFYPQAWHIVFSHTTFGRLQETTDTAHYFTSLRLVSTQLP